VKEMREARRLLRRRRLAMTDKKSELVNWYAFRLVREEVGLST